MTRSHVLLHCTNVRLVAARQEAWGRVGPEGVWMLLASPRWEKRLLHFLELLGVGRIMENGEDDEEVRAAGRDGWIIWEDKADMARSQIDWFCVFLRMPGRASGLGWGKEDTKQFVSFFPAYPVC
jgi:hypothetical protein